VIRCDFTDLPAESCAHCLGHADPFTSDDKPDGTGPGPVFTASYPGRCDACDFDFAPGDQIRATGLGHGYLGPCCGEV
jgi:hypothetical protein